ncbi:MAG: formylglycine-generating enzyme family protein [Planctomycetaceae bacterium]|nr:formylglycine-generating enzyme family protein [Planctomycetaceae bacterium]
MPSRNNFKLPALGTLAVSQVSLMRVLFVASCVLLQSPASSATEPPRPVETVRIPDTDLSLELVSIPGGTFLLGSPSDEPARFSDEGPQVEVRIEPFWMAKYETTWELYEVFQNAKDIERRRNQKQPLTSGQLQADAITRPSKEYMDGGYGMGRGQCPVVNVTQYSAKTFCEWLSVLTGDYYRLPTEAEWEYACRAGTTTTYSFGDDLSQLQQYAWFYTNSDERYHPVGQKKPNPWGLYDMHGNVSEWCLDQYLPGYYRVLSKHQPVEFPLAIPAALYPRVVRGGSWDSDAEYLRSAARDYSKEDWKIADPQLPRSPWYHTDASWNGFRVIRPEHRPSPEEIRYWKLGPDLIEDHPLRDEP